MIIRKTRAAFITLIIISITIFAHENKFNYESITKISTESNNSNGTNSSGILEYQSLGKTVPITGNIDQMKYFVNAFRNVKSEPLRIAHYGDSMIFGDVISMHLRTKLQQKFGGLGVGLLNIVAEDARMRLTVSQTYSTDWENVSFITRNPQQLPFGITGALAIPKVGSWVKFETSSYIKTNATFNFVRVFYSNADQTSTLQYSIDNGQSKKVNLEGGNGINELQIKSNNASKKIEIQFTGGKIPYIYAVSLESTTGNVYVDNIAMRGNSGVALLDIPEAFLMDFNRYLHYDLIIFNYGANVYSLNKGIYTVYENKMTTAIERYKKCFPNTSFLLVSTADRVKKVGSKLVTDPDLSILIDTQKRIADKTKIAFWNLFEAMGGENSMPLWVDYNPPMANRDYVHFNELGGEKIASYLIEALQNLAK